MSTRLVVLAAAAALAGSALAGPLAAPLAAQAPAAAPLPPERNSIATNFVGIPFGLFSLEFEHALAVPGLTVGVGGSHYAGDANDSGSSDDRNSWLEGKVQYYPGERSFRGLSVGLTAGVHSARGVPCAAGIFSSGCASTAPKTQAAGTVGVLVNYDWLIGRLDRFRLGLGVGAKRVVRNVRDDRDVLDQVYPDGRFVIGFTF